MRIKNILHKGLRRLIEADDVSGVQPELAGKLLRMVAFLQDMKNENQLHQVPMWKPHVLSGNRKGTLSLFVSKNWRLTFSIDKSEIEIIDLNYEDYH